jgi:hypothetical protein
LLYAFFHLIPLSQVCYPTILALFPLNSTPFFSFQKAPYGHERAANELRKRGIIISGGGVRSVWLRNDLENFKKRLKALEAKVANDGIVLNDVQLAALEKAKNKREATGEIVTSTDYSLRRKL